MAQRTLEEMRDLRRRILGATIPRARTTTITRGRGGTDDDTLEDEKEQERISTRYISKKRLREIINIKTAKKAFESLTNPKENTKGAQGAKDFKHLVGGASKKAKDKFIRALFNKYVIQNSAKIINRQRVRLKSGRRIGGFQVSRTTYLRVIRQRGRKLQVVARSFETGESVDILPRYAEKVSKLIESRARK